MSHAPDSLRKVKRITDQVAPIYRCRMNDRGVDFQRKRSMKLEAAAGSSFMLLRLITGRFDCHNDGVAGDVPSLL
jgi:hypothetical protein